MDFKHLATALVLASLTASLSGPPALAGDRDVVDWNKAQAGKYLRERATTWFEFTPADRGQGPNKTSCVSCHTLLSCAVAGPVLRKLTGAVQPLEYEKAVLDQVRRRVTHWKELDSDTFGLLYSFSEQKKREAWGTEAVLNSLILALDDQHAGRPGPSEFTKQALVNLWQVQALDGDHKGSWEWLNFDLEPWESKSGRYFGAALAAVAVGSAPGYLTPGQPPDANGRVQLLRNYLRDHLAGQNLNNRIWMLWASTKLEGLLTKEEQRPLVQAILDKQHADGGWSLASLGPFTRKDGSEQATDSDGYASGLILHVLQCAGVASHEAQVAKGLAWLRSHQAATGEWRTSSVNKKRNSATHVGKFMSDAATAYAILALSH
jgi:squalene-hopene/tetraprenyl-beta-curcumene cyclase